MNKEEELNTLGKQLEVSQYDQLVMVFTTQPAASGFHDCVVSRCVYRLGLKCSRSLHCNDNFIYSILTGASQEAHAANEDSSTAAEDAKIEATRVAEDLQASPECCWPCKQTVLCVLCVIICP